MIMNPLIKKEIRLIFPAWFAVLVLEATLPWMLNDNNPAFEILPYFFFLGIIIPAISSFGREFSSGTFQMLMSQPIERGRIWRIKMVVLACSSTLIFLVYFLSCQLKLETYGFDYNRFESTYAYGLQSMNTFDAYRVSITASPIVGLVALVGGLWTTLLFRQVATGFWATLLAPAGLATLVFYFIPARASGQTFHLVLGITAVAYILTGLWAARRLFYSAQDIGWTGGTVSLDRWRYFEAATETSTNTRRFRPIFAILQKEFQLHAITLVGAIALLILQIAIFFVRAHYLKFHKSSDVIPETYFFSFLWLLLPLVIGCASIAEERKPGILDNQFCLPVSKRSQFLIKFLPAIIFGVLLGGIVPLALEMMAGLFGAPNEMFKATDDKHQIFVGVILYLSLGFSLAGFYGSALAKNFLQALSIAIAVIVCCFFLMPAVEGFNHMIPRLFPRYAENLGSFYNYGGFVIISPILFGLIALIVIPFILIYISYLNFTHAFDTRHSWRRNFLVLAGSLVFIGFAAKGIYYRPWEIFAPMGPAAGPVRLSSQAPAQISGESYNGTSANGTPISESLISAVLPDGRLWIKYYNHNDYTLLRSHALQEFQQFEDGSNWVAAAAGDQGVLGIRADGTLWQAQRVIWVDGSARLNLSQVGGDADWFQVAAYGQYLLLQKNGTLWTWGKVVTTTVGTPPYQSTVFKHADPERLDGGTNWAKIIPGDTVYVEKNDGSCWKWEEEWEHTGRITQHIVPVNGTDLNLWGPEVKPDGTLWFHFHPYQWDAGLQTITRDMVTKLVTIQLGADAKWKSAIVDNTWPPHVVALRNDGTLWKWEFSPWNQVDQTQPTQVGNYTNWIALLPLNGNGVALAADGSLWAWDRPTKVGLLAPSRKPEFIANIFSATTSESSQ
jgi:ABC-type transport system involved in multi-copper enzyme maturation permease subunit